MSSLRIRAIIRVYPSVLFLRAARQKVFASGALKLLFPNKSEWNFTPPGSRKCRTVRVHRMPLSAVQFTLVIWPATTSASKRQRPTLGAASSLRTT